MSTAHLPKYRTAKVETEVRTKSAQGEEELVLARHTTSSWTASRNYGSDVELQLREMAL